MPTIKDLPLALAAADGDLLPISQGGVARRVSRAQFLAGMQPALAVQPGVLLGRSSPGVGSAERIGVGANLRLVDGTLSAAAPFSVAGLPGGIAPGPGDLVGVLQGGRDAAVSHGAFMAGLGGVAGIDLSAQLVQAPGGFARSLADWTADAMPAEAFGAVGNGITDDTAALDRAVASGRPVRLGPRVYAVRGQWTISSPATLIGMPGRTVLRRLPDAGGALAGGAFIDVAGSVFSALGITFDAGRAPGDSWGVLVSPFCVDSLFSGCVFQGALGDNLGSGLVIQARDGGFFPGSETGSPSRHRVLGCEARDNQVHGIWIQAASGALVEGCVAHGNGGYGICLDFNDPAFRQMVRHGRVLGCEAWGNRRGISIGNFNETNAEPPRWGHARPDAVGVVVAGNACHGNTSYGIAVAGRTMQVVGNEVSGNGDGILVNAMQSHIAGNTVSGPSYFGIDAGGCVDCDVSGNLVQGCSVGINPGGSRRVRVAGNNLLDNIWGITAYNVETDGHVQNFGIACEGLTIEGNRITLKDGSGGRVYLIDAPQDVVVARNAFFSGNGGSPSQALWAHTDGVLVRDNTWDNRARMICNPIEISASGVSGAVGGVLQQIQIPDMLDEVMVTSAGRGVQSIVGAHQAATAGQIGFVRVFAGGAGYTQAGVTISGAGAGAQAVAHVRDGAVLGVSLTNAGSGYAAGATVVITGDGQGAVAAAVAGLPVHEERRVRLHCNCAVRFKRVGSAPFQDNWTGTDILVPAGTAIDWTGTWGGWQATAFAPADYLAPTGDGSLVLLHGDYDLLAISG